MSSPEIGALLENSKDLDRMRKEQEDVLVEINNKMHKKLQNTPEVVEKPGDSSLSKSEALYTHAKELSESEVSVSNMLLVQLDTLLPSGPPGQQRRRIEGNDQKRRKVKTDSDISRISPNVRSQLEAWASLQNEQVAARVTPDDSEKDHWFVVKVMHFDKETKEFEVLDEEAGDADDATYKLPMSNIIPFPKRNDPPAQDFPPGRQVLAVYPKTTALYKATVVNSNRKRKTDEYLLEFDDDEEDGSLPQRSVPFHKVVPLPEGHRQ